MPWTETTRCQYERNNERYSSDVTDAEWAVIFPLLPGPNKLGRPREVELREVRDGIGYIAAAGCAWSLLPKDFPPVSTVRYYFYNWRDGGLLAEINHALVALAREWEARDHHPTAGIIDSQSVKTTENGGISGYDAGKKIKGRKRHIMTDTCGHLLASCVHAANIQDRDGAVGVFQKLKRDAPKLRHVFADCGYRGPKLRSALITIGRWTIQIVKRSDTAEGFEVLPRRWVVERTLVLERVADHRLTPSTNSCRGTGSPKTSKTRPDRTDTYDPTSIKGSLVSRVGPLPASSPGPVSPCWRT